MDKNYKYYKKIFGNIYLSDLIFKHVCFKEWETDKDYNEYNEIDKSFKTQDITSFERLLYGSCNIGNSDNGSVGGSANISFNGSFFDDYFDFYFYVAIYNPSKYWYYNLSGTLTSIDLYYILRYKEMGFQRFSLIYSSYEQSFKDNQTYILKDAAAGGNFEIYSFLLEQGYPHLHLSNRVNTYDYEEEFHNVSIFTAQPTSTRKNKSQELSINCFFENGGNLEIFCELYEFYKPIMGQTQFDKLFCWLSQQPGQIEQLKFLFQSLQTYNKHYFQGTFEMLVGHSLNFGNLELAEYLVHEHNDGETFNQIYKDGNSFLNIKTIDNPIRSHWAIPINNVNIIVFQFYWSRYILLNPTLEYIQWKMKFLEAVNLVEFNFEIVNFNRELIILQTTEKKGYLPDYQEFQYLVENESIHVLNKLNLKFFNRLIIKQTTSTTTPFNYNYVGYILNYCIGKFKSYRFPVDCFDTNFEMVQYLWTNFENQIPTSVEKSNFNSYNGDLKSVEFFYSLFLSGDNKYKNSFYSLDNQVFERAITNGHYEIVVYFLNNLKKPKQIYPITNLKYGLNHFKVFQVLSKQEMNAPNEEVVVRNGQSIYPLISNSIEKLEPMYVYYILENNIYNHTTRLQSNVSADPNYLIKFINFELDLPIFKLLFTLFNQIFTSNEMMLYIFNKCNYTILEWYFQIGGVKPSTINDKQYQSKLILQLLESTSKFSFFIENDANLIYQCQNEIIQYSTTKRNPIILNYIFSNNSKLNNYINRGDGNDNNLIYNDDFKLLLFIKSVIYSVSSIILPGDSETTNSSTNDDYLWMFNLILNEIEKPKLKLFGKLLTVKENGNDCLLTNYQLNSINICFKQYFEPNLKNLKKKNLNLILVCHFIIGLNK